MIKEEDIKENALLWIDKDKLLDIVSLPDEYKKYIERWWGTKVNLQIVGFVNPEGYEVRPAVGEYFTIVIKKSDLEKHSHLGTVSEEKLKEEQVSHPYHYYWLKDLCGVEPIDICRHFDFAVGNALKYLMRKGKVDGDKTEKEKRIEDLKKAVFYLQDEIMMLEAGMK